MRRPVVLLALMLFASGCWQVRFTRRVPAEPLPRSETWHHSLVNGLWTVSEPTDVHRICPHGFARVENEQTPVNALAQVGVQGALGGASGRATGAGGAGAAILLQLWHPTTVRVWCAREQPRPVAKPVEQLPPVELERPLSLALLPINARTGVSDEEAELFTDSLAGELRRVQKLSVVTRQDLAVVLSVEQQKQLLGCEGESDCLADLEGALGVDRIVHGSVGRIGGSVVVNLFSVSPLDGRTMGSASERLQSDSNEALFDALPRLVRALLAGETRS